jgi:hypothetical protein
VPAEVAIYHGTGRAIFVFTPAVGPAFVTRGTISRRGVLTADVPPQTTPTVPPTSVALTKLNVRIGKRSRRVRRVRRNLLTSPRVCNGRWTTTIDFTYEDGSTLTLRSNQSCVRTPRRRR